MNIRLGCIIVSLLFAGRKLDLELFFNSYWMKTLDNDTLHAIRICPRPRLCRYVALAFVLASLFCL